MSEQQPTDESWDGLLSNFLKAEDLKEQEGSLVCIGVDVGEDNDGKSYMHLDVEVNGKTKIWTLNKTNRLKLKEKLARPKDALGKKLGWKKVTTTNPSTKKEVEALRITSIE